jgi:hypothetical protein
MFTSLGVQSTIPCVLMPCSSVGAHRRFGRKKRLHLHENLGELVSILDHCRERMWRFGFLGSRWRWMVSFRPQPYCSARKEPLLSTGHEGPTAGLNTVVKRKNFCSSRESNSNSPAVELVPLSLYWESCWFEFGIILETYWQFTATVCVHWPIYRCPRRKGQYSGRS